MHFLIRSFSLLSFSLLSLSLFSLSIIFAPSPAHAYIGPGMTAGGMILFALFTLSILLALYALVIYPIRVRLKRRASHHESSDERPES